jgi:TolA-binding protein
MRHQLRVSLVSLATALLTTGCFFPYESGMLLSRDLDALQKSMRDTRNNVEARGVQLEEQSTKLESQISQADEKLGEVAETLDTLNRAARLSNADFGVQLERMLQELQELRGAIELADYRISRMEQQIAANSGNQTAPSAPAYAQRDERPAPAAKPKAQSTTTKPKATAKATPKPAPEKPKAPAKPATPKEQIADARSLIKQNKYDQARGILRQVLNGGPRQAGVHDLAHYELGKSYQSEKKYRAALQEYIKVAEQFPKGTMVDDAYFQIGNCSMALGNLEEAEVFFNEIITNHKRSPFAKDAKAKLSEVKKRLKAERTQG